MSELLNSGCVGGGMLRSLKDTRNEIIKKYKKEFFLSIIKKHRG